MKKHLVIVESPAKAKTIAKFLGSDYIVKSSFGHIRDLPKKSLAIDKEHGFAPTYEISPDKKKEVSELRAAAKGVEDVWLATDEDREGEAIAWHLCNALKLDPKSTKRIVFHEITKPAITAAIAKPRFVDLQLVDAQQARRVLDRLVGYELSPVLWRKVRSGLSAGRVQSVAVRLIVEREREIQEHLAESSFKITADLLKSSHALAAELPDKLKDDAIAEKFLSDCTKASFEVTAVDEKPGSRSPSPPFTTSTLQQEAARRLGFSVKQTMTLAQRLYENGDITYMRTDSTVLAATALDAAASYIRSQYGDKYLQTRQYKTKSKSAQEAHEAIRPTNFTTASVSGEAAQTKLYKLIWQRALASQMSPAAVQRTEVKISISTRPEHLVAKGEVLTFDGFLKVYGGAKEDTILPPVAVGDALDLRTMTATQTFTKPAARYSEASLVRTLEQMGIGRPSTFAPTISTVQTRGYVEKRDEEGEQREIVIIKLVKGEIKKSTQELSVGTERNKLFPTALALMTNDFLVKYFGPIVDFDFTRTVEEEFDEIEAGKREWNAMISEFYSKEFTPLLKASADVSRAETSQARLVGADPTTKLPIYARYGRYGPMLQRGETENSDVKPDFALIARKILVFY